MAEEKSVFQTLFDVDVSEYTDERKNLTYLSWSHALSETMKLYPNMTYTIKTFGESNLPYVYDPQTGYMVFTSVTIDGLTKEMWLPVMDTNNKAMKAELYTFDRYDKQTKTTKKITVEAATMFDINKTLMRCLVKNLAAFGLGMYIYNKDDLPESTVEQNEEEERKARELAEALAAAIKEITTTGTALISAGYTRDDMYEVVGKHNNGETSPSKIATLEIAAEIKKEFDQMLANKSGEKKSTKKTTKKTTEEEN